MASRKGSDGSPGNIFVQVSVFNYLGPAAGPFSTINLSNVQMRITGHTVIQRANLNIDGPGTQLTIDGASAYQTYVSGTADVNQATLFEHFESKEAIFQHAVVLPLLEAMRGMRERGEAYSSARSLAELKELADASTKRHIQVMAHDDAREAFRAFVEKRPPKFGSSG